MTARVGRHILMTADAIGGVWQYATDLAAVLGADGHRVTLAVLGPDPSPGQRAAAERIEGLDLVATGLPLDWLAAGPEAVEAAAAALADLVRQRAVHLVHCNSPALCASAVWPVPVVAVAHGCVTTWWQAAHGAQRLPPALSWHRRMMTRGLGAADAVVAPSAAFAQTLRAAYNLAALPQVVHNGRRPLPVAGASAEPLDAVLTIGRLWDPVKGAALLDEVAEHLSRPLLAVGETDGPGGEHFAAAHLQALGTLDDAAVGAMLARRPVFVSAASFEPFGLAVLEAAQAGCPLVLSDIPTFRELWGDAALFVDPAEGADGFLAALERLAADPVLREELGTAAMARATRYTPQASGAAMLALYERLLTSVEAAAA